jgi:hypothetical protein
MKTRLFVLAGAAISVIGTAHGADLFSDDFEGSWIAMSTGTYHTFNAGPATAQTNGWAVGATSIDLVREHWAGFGADPGNYWLDLAGTPGPGSIDRSLTVQAGHTYTVSFDAFTNNGGDVVAMLGSSILSLPGALVGSGTHQSFTYTAASNSATLEFSTHDRSNGNTGIDNIRVQTVPEPFTMLLMGGAAIASASRLRKQRKQASV